jgi:hypothetical protein
MRYFVRIAPHLDQNMPYLWISQGGGAGRISTVLASRTACKVIANFPELEIFLKCRLVAKNPNRSS